MKKHSDGSTPGQPGARAPFRHVLRWAGAGMLALILLLTTLWAAAALFIDVRVSWLRAPLATGFLLAVVATWILVRGRWWKIGLTVGAFAAVLVWWLALQPSNERDWQPDVAVLADADIDGDKITVRNIRNCDYRTETDYDVRHYDRTFDLARLRTVDLFMVYWGSPAMAHTMMSFGFEGGEQLCFSIETRKEKGEGYSAVKGLFRQFELIYIVGDERDVVRLRTNYRQGEETYLFRLNTPPEAARVLLLDYLRRLNELKRRPEWYSAVTQNCTTSIRSQRQASARAPWDWRMLANGYGDELLYERGTIDTSRPLAEVKQRAHINARARAADKAADFSRQIRQGATGNRL